MFSYIKLIISGRDCQNWRFWYFRQICSFLLILMKIHCFGWSLGYAISTESSTKVDRLMLKLRFCWKCQILLILMNSDHKFSKLSDFVKLRVLWSVCFTYIKLSFWVGCVIIDGFDQNEVFLIILTILDDFDQNWHISHFWDSFEFGIW